MRVYGHDFNDPGRWAVVHDGEPVPAIGEAGLLRDFEGEFQCSVTVISIERNHDDTCWIVEFDQTGPIEYLDNGEVP